MKSIPFIFAILGSATQVAGHALFQNLWVGGVDQASSCIRMPKNNSPVTDVSSTDVRCNVGGAAGVPGVCEVQAGQGVSVEMHAQPGDRKCGSEAIGGNHFGPVIVYMSKVADASTADGSSDFFKIGEFGYNAANKTWGTDMLNANCGRFDVTVPASLAPGDYLMRAEAIALHTASQVNGAQLYMSCYQIRVTGGGGAAPTGVKFPGAYKATDPGIRVDIWNRDFNQYTIPGPTVPTF